VLSTFKASIVTLQQYRETSTRFKMPFRVFESSPATFEKTTAQSLLEGA
jgi:hypothetical protein